MWHWADVYQSQWTAASSGVKQWLHTKTPPWNMNVALSRSCSPQDAIRLLFKMPVFEITQHQMWNLLVKKQKREAWKWISQRQSEGEIFLFGDYDWAVWRRKKHRNDGFVLQNGIFRGEETSYFDEWWLCCTEIGWENISPAAAAMNYITEHERRMFPSVDGSLSEWLQTGYHSQSNTARSDEVKWNHLSFHL